MAIWINELEATPAVQAAHPTPPLRSRNALICLLERKHMLAQLSGRTQGSVLVMLCLVPRHSLHAEEAPPLDCLHEELLKLPYESYRMRDGEQALFVDQNMPTEQLRQLLAGLSQRVKARAGNAWALVVGAAAERELGRGRFTQWLSLAEERLHRHAGERGAQLPIASLRDTAMPERRQLH